MPETSKDLPPLLERAQRFFEAVGASAALKAHLAQADQAVQFNPLGGEPFFVRLQAGKVEFGKGKKFQEDVEGGLCITEVQDSLDAIFKGEITLGEALFHQKIRIPGYRNKEPAIAGFSKTLRLGIWAIVSAPPQLMPIK